MSAFVPLARAGPECGQKAVTLGRLVRAGFAVPDGVVLPPGPATSWRREVPHVLAALGGGRFAVRSSAPGEDGSVASFAGQLHTSLDVPAGRVVPEVERVAASAGLADDYAAAVGQAAGPVAVLVQRMVAPVAAGVAFTRHPVTGEAGVVVEAVPGLGGSLVSGGARPQRWHGPSAERLTATGPPVLSAEQVLAVAQVAARAEQLLGGGQDVEWAITDEGRVWLLQARPITASPAVRPSGTAALADVIAHGTPASPGTASGNLHVIDGLDDFAGFGRGEVLVCRATSPAWMPVLARAAAVVTEQGGILSHAAIVARELRIPAVTDVAGATRLPALVAVVDGSAGSITAGATP